MKKIVLLSMILVLMLSFVLYSAQGETDPKTMTKIEKLMEKVAKAMEKKDAPAALKIIDEVLELKGDYMPALHQKARFFYGQDPDQAIALLNQALSADAAYLPAVKDLATLHYRNAQKLQQSDPSAAAAAYEKAASIDRLESAEKGLLAETLFNAGALYYQQRNLEKAIAQFEHLTALKELQNEKQQNAVRLAHYMLGMAQVQHEQVEDAQKNLSRYIELSKDTAGDLYLPVARFILAETMMNELNAQAEAINRDQKENKGERIAALAATRPEVVSLLEQAMAEKPDIAESARMYLGNYQYLSGNVDQAIACYEALIKDFSASEQLGVYQNFLKEIKGEKERRQQEAKNKGKK